MSVPAQKPGRSKQDYPTPWPFIRALEAKYGPLAVDLAATEENKKAPVCITIEEDSLTVKWHRFTGLLWLNPPFADIGTWAKKCREESQLGAKIIMLTPASVATEWYAEHCHDIARTVFVRPRLTFIGCDDPYPKDLMLTLWGIGQPGYEIWKWLP